MSIFKGKNNYNSDKEFTTRTIKRLKDKSKGNIGTSKSGFLHDGGDFRNFPKLPPYVIWIRDQIGKNNELNILEVGCGFGRWAPILEGYYKTYTGVDITKERIEYANKNYKKENRTFKHVGKEWNFDVKFDVIFCCYVLQHLVVPDTIALLKNMERNLKDDGKILAWEQKMGQFTVDEAEWAYIHDCGETIIPKPFCVLEDSVPLKWKCLEAIGSIWPKVEWPKNKKDGFYLPHLNGLEAKKSKTVPFWNK